MWYIITLAAAAQGGQRQRPCCGAVAIAWQQRQLVIIYVNCGASTVIKPSARNPGLALSCPVLLLLLPKPVQAVAAPATGAVSLRHRRLDNRVLYTLQLGHQSRGFLFFFKKYFTLHTVILTTLYCEN